MSPDHDDPGVTIGLAPDAPPEPGAHGWPGLERLHRNGLRYPIASLGIETDPAESAARRDQR